MYAVYCGPYDGIQAPSDVLRVPRVRVTWLQYRVICREFHVTGFEHRVSPGDVMLVLFDALVGPLDVV